MSLLYGGHTRIMIYLKEILLVFIISTRVDAGCQDRGCSRFEEGAQCYAMTPDGPFGPSGLTKGLDCAKSDRLCLRSPRCQCCNKKCGDTGCSRKWDGRGRCSDRKFRGCVESKELCQRSKRKLNTLKLNT